jgi:hypothetical protein
MAPAPDCTDGRLRLEGGRCTEPWPCPVGWDTGRVTAVVAGLEVADVCGPEPVVTPTPRPPDASLAACPRGELATPEGDCAVPASGRCPADMAPPGAASTLHVNAAAPADTADGTVAHPFPTLAAAIEVAPPGALVVLASGRYTDPVLLARDVHLWGRCADEVSIGPLEFGVGTNTVVEGITVEPGPDHPGAAIVLRGDDAALRGVRVQSETGAAVEQHTGALALTNVALASRGAGCVNQRGGQSVWHSVVASPCAGPGAVLESAALSEWEDVRITAVSSAGVLIRGATLQAARVEIAGVVPGGDGPGEGVRVEQAGHLVAADLIVREVSSTGLRTMGPGASAEGRRLVVVDARPGADAGANGWGIEVGLGASMLLQDVLVERTTGVGVLAHGGGTSLTLEDAIVRETGPQPDGRVAGKGIAVEGAASASLRRVHLQSNRETGLHVSRAATLDAEGLSVLDTLPRLSDDRQGWGLNVQSGARVMGRDVWVSGSADMGIQAAGEGTRVELERLTVRETMRAPAAEAEAAGIRARAGAVLVVRGGLIQSTDGQGAELRDSGTRGELTDVTILESGRVGGMRAPQAVGLLVIDGAEASLARVRVAGSLTANAWVTGAGSHLEARQLVLRDGELPGDSGGGAGLAVLDGGNVVATDTLFWRHSFFALSVDGAGSRLELGNARIDDDLDALVGPTMGRGIEVGEGAFARLERVEIAHQQDFGVLSIAGEVELRHVDVHDIGAEGQDAFGVFVQSGGHIEIADVSVRRARGGGVAAVGAETGLDGHRLTVEDTSAGAGGLGGRGIAAASGAQLTLGHAESVGNSQAGLSIHAATASAHDLLVSRTGPDRTHPGDGVFVDSDADLEMTRFRLQDNRRAGLVLSAASATVESGLIGSNAVGVVTRLNSRLNPGGGVAIVGNGEDSIVCETVCAEYESSETLVPLPE